jgi:flavin-dependent dehydrogenase
VLLQQRSHLLGFRRRQAPLALDRVLLVGDAAGLVDPNTGGGIGWALRSAQLASAAILSYLGGAGSRLGEQKPDEFSGELAA